MIKYCEQCGAALEENDAFCQQCGHPAAYVPPETPVMPSAAPAPGAPPAYYPPAKPKRKTGLIIGICAAIIVIAGLLTVLLVPGILGPSNTTVSSAKDLELLPLASDLKIISEKVEIHCTYDYPDIIVPALYRSLDSIVYLKCWTDFGATEALVTVEIPGFTQKYEQKIPITRAETQIKIHPPLVEGAAKNLNSSKSAQLKVSVTEIGSGKILIQDSKEVQLYSRYDMQWAGEDGTRYHENFLAWLTPEAPEIKYLLRDSADSLSYLSNGTLTSLVGYQKAGNFSEADMTYMQAWAIMYTLANKYQVKYVASPFSSTATNLQRVKTPAEVITSSSGLCCETAVTVASALQAMNMHAVLILLPGHMQTAVETWPGTGEYWIIETTALDAAATGNFNDMNNYVMPYDENIRFTKDKWLQYISQEGYEVIDCDLAQVLKIQSID